MKQPDRCKKWACLCGLFNTIPPVFCKYVPEHLCKDTYENYVTPRGWYMNLWYAQAQSEVRLSLVRPILKYSLVHDLKLHVQNTIIYDFEAIQTVKFFLIHYYNTFQHFIMIVYLYLLDMWIATKQAWCLSKRLFRLKSDEIAFLCVNVYH